MQDWKKTITEAKKDDRSMEDFIGLHEAFILKSASKASRRFVSKSDDEWSVSLSAFTEAMDKYDSDKGGFLTYASVIIRSRLIDWFRINGRQSSDLHTEDMYIEKEDKGYNDDLRLEIYALGETLDKYGISFVDIADNSPKAGKTRESCRTILRYLLDNPILVAEIRRTGSLPLKILENNLDLPRKIMERHRKYIIAAMEILTGDYPYLSEYLRYVREEE